MPSTAKVTIIGQPNVGKSTLFNRLVGSNQAIVSGVAGTTRDLVSATIQWRSKNFELIDTAGLNKAKDALSSEAMALIEQAIETTSVIVLVVDGTTMLGDYDRQLARQALKSRKPVILAINKADQAKKLQTLESFNRLGIKQIQPVSAIQGSGSGDLLDTITDHLSDKSAPGKSADIKVAILGRPNVGKSSLLNKLIGSKAAITSEVAGTTRDVNYGRIKYDGQSIELADTAGLRRPGKIGRDIEYFSSLRTKKAIAKSDICLLLIDATEPSVSQDQKIAGLVAETGKSLIIVVNKWDAVDKDDKTMARMSRLIGREFQFAWWAPLVFTSTLTGQNQANLVQIIADTAKKRQTQIPTTQLNQIISDATSKQPPAGLQGKRPKIKYAVQKDVSPPHFIIFTSYADLVHFSYRRYLENKLREAYDFTGTPITIEFKHKSK